MLPQATFWRNLRDLPASMSLSAVVAGFLVVLVGYTGPLLIVLQAAEAGGLTESQTSSWVWACTVSYGVTSILMSLWYRQPLTAPWSTAGAALLVTSLAQYTLAQAVGAYIVAAIAIVLLGFSGLFGRAMALVPQPIFMGVLAGVLLRFGIGLFNVLPEQPIMVIAMILIFFVLKRFNFRAPTLGALIVGILIAALGGQLNMQNVPLTLTVPEFTAPEFDLRVIFSLSMPLVALALTSQYAPGQAVLKSSGYEPPINGILVFTGLSSIVFAPFGSPGSVLGALTAAMLTNPEAHPDPNKRYAASVAMGAFYILFGMFGAAVVGLFAGFPPALIAAVAGLALSGTIGSSLTGAMADSRGREGALVAFLCTAGNFSLLGIGAPFWGLVAGIGINAIMQYGKPELKPKS